MTSTIAARSLHAEETGRPSPGRLVFDQVVYALRELWRTRFVLIFTYLLPLVWLVIIGLLAGNDVIDSETGLRVMQFVTPTAAVMGVLFATYPPLGTSLALAREQKILKRLQGTPLPSWAYLLGRVGGAVILAISAVVLMLLVGVTAYDVQLLGRTALATLVTLIVGIGSFAALGLAVGALVRSTSLAQTVTVASGVLLTFISGIFVIGAEMPAWLDRLAGFFPVRHLVTALQDQFNPYLAGAGWDPAALAVMAGWGLAGLVVAVWALRREPATGDAGKTAARAASPSVSLAVTETDRPTSLRLVLDQTRWANRAARRDPGWIFFAVLMPIGLYALMNALYGGGDFRPNEMDFAFFFACGMAAYGAAVTAFINMPEAVATARDRGVLKRLRGTPVELWHYLVGRTSSALWISLLTAVLVFAVGLVFFEAEVDPVGIPLGFLVVVLGTLTLAACGYALAAMAPSARAASAIGLGILLPLSFFSDVFLIGGAPDWMASVGSLFPLRHFVHALAASLDPSGTSVPWVNLAVMFAWLAAATVVAARRFRWDAKS